VGIQSPDGISALRGILRRFSDFLKLFTAVSICYTLSFSNDFSFCFHCFQRTGERLTHKNL
jgi:hypothetical protein